MMSLLAKMKWISNSNAKSKVEGGNAKITQREDFLD